MTRNIGIKVSETKNAIKDGDEKNPFNGTLPIRGKIFEGRVSSINVKNTVVIEKESPVRFSKFKRYARGKSSIHAHVPSNIEVNYGDKVMAAECRPVAKSVSFVIIEVLK
ncbi:MAG: ribosomal protein S17 [Cenarchaeum symbiont of Oopsacas minuta]|nr:ribosomal protein S17 [Cenarchaeum symbiont of Oopsacas minuta]